QAKAFFNLLPADYPEFDHFRPAAWLFENTNVLTSKSKAAKETLERAEALISDINACFSD
ncbi:MAG: hypothetical protein R3360_01230, partial [Alphaproteobacteria bacterium]|nr:hypothetical protein [Alphaproteobacteria bacterium]